MDVELLAIGTELLLGQLVDTNTPYVAARLADVGANVFAAHTVGDNKARIAAAMRAALERADGVITTGGLGPTVDDMTRDAACEALGLESVLHQPSVDAMKAMLASMGRPERDLENNLGQAYTPVGSYVLENPNGSAPGFVAFDARGKFVASMPGVPSEMKAMLAERLIPYLRERYDLRERITTAVIHTIGIAEAEIDRRIGDLFATLENPKIAVLAHGYTCDVKVMAKAGSAAGAEALIAPVRAELEGRLEGYVYGRDAETIEGAVQRELLRRGQTIAVAESCTGGRVASGLTAAPGSSAVFVGAVVAYDNAVKRVELDVPPAVLTEHGAVSEETARAMAAGVRARLKTDVGFATTGIAGPGGGSEQKPVGLVWFALALPDGRSVAQKMNFRGDRNAVQTRASIYALGMLWKGLRL
jgi:nicotinamide-nucleotide amidase